MSEWKKVKLGDVIEINKNSIGRNYQHETIHYYDISSIGTGSIDGSSKLLLVDAPSRAKRIVNDGDTVIATVRPGNKSYYHFTSTRINDIVSTGFAVLTAKADINHKFLYYLVTNDSFTKYLVSNERGATYPAVSASDFHRATIQLPPLPTQKEIAKVLSNYDDLIENNLKRIKLLEESARLTYEEWFLRFRIDGQKLDIDSETGLPFGWEKRKLQDVTSYVARGISPRYVEVNGVIVLNQKCIRDNFVNINLGRLHSLDKKVSQQKNLQFGDILINSTGTGTLGRVAQIFETIEGMTVDSHVSIVRANKMLSPYILGRALEYLEEYITNLGKGATNQQELGRADLESLVQVIIPAEDHQNRYKEYAAPIFKIINNLRKENQLLKEARDIILPRLMTGMIDTDDIEVAV